MGQWSRWWWTGVLLVGTSVNCGKSTSDGKEPEGDAGNGSAGAPSPIPGGGAAFDDDETAGAGGERFAVGGSGFDVEALGGAGGADDPVADEGGPNSEGDMLISDELIADDAEVVTETCDGGLGQASIELTRYCLLLANCRDHHSLLGE